MLEQFYGDILPDQGHYCLFLADNKTHLWADTLGELAEMTVAQGDRLGVYFGTAAYKTTANRTQANVLSLKALRLDIDAGEKKHARNPDGAYPSQRDARNALAGFIRDVGFKPSYVVSSGEGLHVYYCLAEAVDPATWHALATGLGQLALDRSLLVDPTVTTDTARILRPIGTLHGNGKVVSVIGRTGVVFGIQDFRDLLPAKPVARPSASYDASINDELNLGYDGPPSSAFKITQHCGALREVATSKGDVQEPLWRAMLGLVKRTVEGIDVAHEWSSGYDGYDAHETERKFDAWTAGPTTCGEFAKHSEACRACQYAGKIKSPINLGLLTAPEIETLPEEKKPAPAPVPAPTGDLWDGHLPPKYSVKTVNGRPTLVYAMETDKETDTGEVVPVVVHVPFTHDIFWFGRWAEANNSDDSAQVTLHVAAGRRVKTYLTSQTVVSSVQKLLEYLAGKAVHATTHRKAGQAMLDYAKAQLNRIKDEYMQPKITDHMGLRILDNGMLVCAQGPHVIYPDGTILEAMLGTGVRSVSEAMYLPIERSDTGSWGAEQWEQVIVPKAHEHVDFLREFYGMDGLNKYRLAIMFCLAGPLMPFAEGSFIRGSKLPPGGLTVSLFSRETARGKTAAIKSALMAFGDPNQLSRDSNTTASTALARIAKMSLHGTVPIGLDEMGNLPPKQIAELVNAIGNGTGRERAMQDGGLAIGNGTWALIAIMAANKSARELVSVAQAESDAIQYRMLELNVENAPEFDLDTRARYTEAAAHVRTTCAGALGGVIHKALCTMGAVAANKLVTASINKAAALVGAGQSARFMYRGLGLVLATQAILARQGLAPFNTQDLIATFKAAHDSSVEFITHTTLPSDGLSLLQMCLNDLTPGTVITQNETRRGGYSTVYDTMLNANMPREVVARHIVSSRTTYVSTKAIRDWCRDNGVSELDIVRAANTSGVFKPMHPNGSTAAQSYNLLKGMKDSTDSRCRVYRVDVAKLNTMTTTQNATEEVADNVIEFRALAEPKAEDSQAAEAT